jgi:hypothetical protein
MYKYEQGAAELPERSQSYVVVISLSKVVSKQKTAFYIRTADDVKENEACSNDAADTSS